MGFAGLPGRMIGNQLLMICSNWPDGHPHPYKFWGFAEPIYSGNMPLSLIALVIAFFYTLPTIFGKSPAVQVSGLSSENRAMLLW
jgi:hypothetical protein